MLNRVLPNYLELSSSECIVLDWPGAKMFWPSDLVLGQNQAELFESTHVQACSRTELDSYDINPPLPSVSNPDPSHLVTPLHSHWG